ncbi:UDP-3-O-(3-hydroxymyristoyl)glucosamine N-acyltransferase [Metabacillus bambusae]|uniref:UDP-3-O-(3-hydroxymyristoyl)glucosamine N-acyltransferase n=1 Tax=Metabacillus bambusae TaxID=2795218 RepID=A0ABS3N0X4_9BACI|nr:UDP-3-O-(3-hydroxymyristoyl)glucosamine N-acyltransferase [Metabacillus bambusae]MBO1511736.1 UDP-3-O-(3-hydroxymyristoyl)glucosamine N-acyltransferase [Metabacillus bambusae]
MSIYKILQPITVRELVDKIRYDVNLVGDKERIIKGVSSLDTTDRSILCFCNAKVEKANNILETTPSDIIIVDKNLEITDQVGKNKTLLLADDPMLYFIECLNLLFPSKGEKKISVKTDISANAIIGGDVNIGSFSIIEEDVYIGRKTSIHNGVHLYKRTKLGENILVQSNTVIGVDGLGFSENQEGEFVTFPHLGGVVIEHDVSIGSNTTIAKGMLTETFIGSGTKIGNQVNIGHNVKIGENCFISSGVIICGSVVIGDNCWIGPGTKIVNGVNIGQNVKIGIGSVVTKDIKANSFAIGVPAKVIQVNN